MSNLLTRDEEMVGGIGRTLTTKSRKPKKNREDQPPA